MELGSEFNLSLSELSIKENNLIKHLEVYPNVAYMDSGRSAIRYFANQLCEEDEVLLPEFICESVISCFRRNKIAFYKITEEFVIDVESLEKSISANTKVIFLMHYFGVLQPYEVLKRVNEMAQQCNCVILEDATHSVFTKNHTIGDYVVSSIRKWMPIPKGGVIYPVSEKTQFNKLFFSKCIDNDKAYGMILKDLFLQDILNCNREYREFFAKNEEYLDKQQEIFGISDFSKYIISCVDIDEMIEKRKRNYSYLSAKLKQMGIIPAINVVDEDCPFVLPIRIPKRDAFRRYLMDNKVYCAVHWPFDGYMEEKRFQAEKNSKELISLPIDQRYSSEHMDYLVKVISRYGGDLSF